MLRLLLCTLLLTTLAVVSACEGDCIVGITNAFLGNYTEPIQHVRDNINSQIDLLIFGQRSQETAYDYLSPILEAYNALAYDGMEVAIFPHYFHGKCQQNGINPSGCPNPDCPVVCGTPGSLVHFYPTLRYIAFNQTCSLLQQLSAPGTQPYQQVEQRVMQAAQANSRRWLRVYPREPAKAKSEPHSDIKSVVTGRKYKTFPSSTHQVLAESPSPSVSVSAPPVPSGALAPDNDGSAFVVPVAFKRYQDSQDIQQGLQEILLQTCPLLENACGGNASLRDCSWEVAMKQYILTFP